MITEGAHRNHVRRPTPPCRPQNRYRLCDHSDNERSGRDKTAVLDDAKLARDEPCRRMQSLPMKDMTPSSCSHSVRRPASVGSSCCWQEAGLDGQAAKVELRHETLDKDATARTQGDTRAVAPVPTRTAEDAAQDATKYARTRRRHTETSVTLSVRLNHELEKKWPILSSLRQDATARRQRVQPARPPQFSMRSRRRTKAITSCTTKSSSTFSENTMRTIAMNLVQGTHVTARSSRHSSPNLRSAGRR